MAQSRAILAAGILLGLGSGGVFLPVVMSMFLGMRLQTPNGPVEGISLVFLILGPVAGLIISWGVLRKQQWARRAMIAVAMVLMAFGGAALTHPFIAQAAAGVSNSQMAAAPLAEIGLVEWLCGAWWLFLFRSQGVRRLFGSTSSAGRTENPA
ncbi:MAG: hypothetical protein HYZ37_15650 [Candidatus Solibacter usitatus]|nr:hypothetical protein [Candidatus Solibacter usitatus]